MNSKRVRILVADDHLVVREGLRLILETESSFEVVAEAENGRDAVRLVAETRPDVVLMDVRMPDMDGIAAIRRIRENHPEVSVVILTTFDEDELIRDGLSAGAHGFLLKDVDRQTLFRAIHAASRGEVLIGHERIRRALDGAGSGRSSNDVNLTVRETEIMRSLVGGARNKEIARVLGISERTVKMHLANVFTKLGVETRAGAAAATLRRRLLD